MDEDRPAEIDWPRPSQGGPEMETLQRFHRDARWTGSVKASGDIPEMTASGHGRFRSIMNGLWIVGEFEQDQFFERRKVTSWQAHYVAGWDAARQTYVAFAADSNGGSVSFTGEIEKGDRFVITSDEVTVSGIPSRFRMIWDLSDPSTVKWLNEVSVAGSGWQLVEEYVCTLVD